MAETSEDTMNQPHDTPPAPPAPPALAPPLHNPVQQIEKKILESQVIEVMRTVYDPEIPVNIYELGMVYGVEVEPPGKVVVKMTLTSPSCPVAGSLPGDVQARVQNIPGVTEARVDLVWDPPWDPSRMSEAAKLDLGMM
jgi:FeS assembly SUF system protein